MTTQSINSVVEVSVKVSPITVLASGFNVGLIMGKSTIITPTERTKIYNSTVDMLADGWEGTEAEYLAAQKYFGQTERPSKVVIGRWDVTETAVEALTACRTSNLDWYACYVCGTAKSDIIAIAAYIEAATPDSVYFYTTKDAEVLAGTAGNIMLTLKESGYSRTLGQYSSVDDAAVAIMGFAMGANTGLLNSAYTLAYKSEVGVTPEALTATQFNEIKEANGNVYTNFGNAYMLFTQGVVADGTPFDEVINLDVLKNGIQAAIMGTLTSLPKVPQTEDGIAILVDAISGPCNNAKTAGIIGPGIWNAPSVLSLKKGDNLPLGYIVLADSLMKQSEADRAARIAPPIYVPIKLAGAIEHVIIQIVVNR